MKFGLSTSARLVGSIVWLALAGGAGADEGPKETKRACAEAANRGQELRDKARYRESQDLLTACAAATCPQIVQENCVRWLNELSAEMPTIVVGAQDADGRDLLDVSVFLDGVPLEGALDGSPHAADPGPHTLRFEAPTGAPIEARIVLRSGEKSRGVIVRFPPTSGTDTENGRAPEPRRREPARATPGLVPLARPAFGAPPVAPPARTGTGLGARIIGFAAVAAGIAGVATASVFGVLAVSTSNAQKSACQSVSDCSDRASALSDHGSAVADATISTVLFIASGALLVSGLLFVVTAGRRAPDARPPSGLLVVPTAGPGVAEMTLQGTF